MSFTCPKCLMVSHNPNDERERYCGNCHRYFTEDDALLAAWKAGQLRVIRPTPQQRAEMAAYIDATQPGWLDELGIERET